jgi:hypothetical protein
MAICFLIAAGWRPNLAAISAVLTPSSAQHPILIFSSIEMSRFHPIAVWHNENGEKIRLKNGPTSRYDC